MIHRLTHENMETLYDLLESGWTQRAIARHLGVSPAAISQTLKRHAIRRQQAIAEGKSDDIFSELKKRAKRCPGCGGLVYEWPCHACHMRQLVQRNVPMKRSA
jgi:IS30 family transposase